MKIKFILPLAIFLGLVAFFIVGLNRDPREIPSPLINKPAPFFKINQLAAANKEFSPVDMRGKVWVFNVWASWCGACREEHPVLMEFSNAHVAPIIGLDYKDKREDALAILADSGNPYVLSAFDQNGRVGIDYGVYGVPETYVIDKFGVIRYKRIGPVTKEILTKDIYPLIEKLNKS